MREIDRYFDEKTIENKNDLMSSVVLEPYGEVFDLEPKSSILFKAASPIEGKFETEEVEGGITVVYSWVGSTTRVFKDGIEFPSPDYERFRVPGIGGFASLKDFMGKIGLSALGPAEDIPKYPDWKNLQ